MRRPLLIAATAALLLTGCGSTKLMGKSLPDETQVIDGPSLVLPPQFELRPPREAQDYESVLRAQKSAEARTLITGVSASVAGVAVSGSVPSGDEWLLKQAADQSGVVSDPNVRQDLEKAAMQPEAEAEKGKQGLFKRWFGKSDE
jgi:hypothetical protein